MGRILCYSSCELDAGEAGTKGQPKPGLSKILTTLAVMKRDPLPANIAKKDFNLPENSNAAWLHMKAAVNEIRHGHGLYLIGGDLSTTDLTCATLNYGNQ